MSAWMSHSIPNVAQVDHLQDLGNQGGGGHRRPGMAHDADHSLICIVFRSSAIREYFVVRSISRINNFADASGHQVARRARGGDGAGGGGAAVVVAVAAATKLLLSGPVWYCPMGGATARGWSKKMNVLISSLCRRKLNPALRAVHPSPALYPGQQGRVAEAPRYTRRGARRNVNAFVN